MPIRNPCALFDSLLQEPNESTWLEFKINNKDPREIGEYVWPGNFAWESSNEKPMT